MFRLDAIHLPPLLTSLLRPIVDVKIIVQFWSPSNTFYASLTSCLRPTLVDVKTLDFYIQCLCPLVDVKPGCLDVKTIEFLCWIWRVLTSSLRLIVGRKVDVKGENSLCA